MIVVVADDLTGAAELGGIGLRQGLSVEINMEVNAATKADLLVIAADTRSMGQDAAVRDMEKITRQLRSLQPEWIYKKVDSVLRGHIVAEISVQLKALELKRALLIPANPALGRTIKDGQYLFNGRPVHKSSFAVDPEFAITSSDVRDMLHAVQAAVHVKKHNEKLPGEGVIIGEVQTRDDLEVWAALAGVAGEPQLLAGAAGFFTALLRERRGPGKVTQRQEPAEQGYPALFVSGTIFGENQTIIRKIRETGGPVQYISAEDRQVNAETETIVNCLLDHGKAIVAIEGTVAGDPVRAAGMLRSRMAQLVSQVLAEVNVEELVIEGGATAYAILERAGLRTFFPEEELAPGVIRMRAGGELQLYVTVKPGSYAWPPSLLHRLET